MKLPEFGYTPANLRALIDHQGWTQKQAAELAGAGERTVRQWLVEDLDSPSHRDMPLAKWRRLLDEAKQPPP